MTQEQIAQNLDRISKTKKSSIAGIFLFIIGTAITALGPGGYFETLNDDTPGVHVGISTLVWCLLIGVPMMYFGFRMIASRNKITKEDVAGNLELGSYVVGVSPTTGDITLPTQQASVTLSPTGIAVGLQSATATTPIVITWNSIKRAEWRSIYNADAYRVQSPEYDITFMVSEPKQSQKRARRDWAVAAFTPRVVGTVSAAQIVGANMGDIAALTPIHLYTVAYNKAAASRWANWFDKFMFSPLPSLAILLVVGVWALGLLEAYGYGAPSAPSGVIIYGGTGYFFFSTMYHANTEFKFAQKITGSKHF